MEFLIQPGFQLTFDKFWIVLLENLTALVWFSEVFKLNGRIPFVSLNESKIHFISVPLLANISSSALHLCKMELTVINWQKWSNTVHETFEASPAWKCTQKSLYFSLDNLKQIFCNPVSTPRVSLKWEFHFEISLEMNTCYSFWGWQVSFHPWQPPAVK